MFVPTHPIDKSDPKAKAKRCLYYIIINSEESGTLYLTTIPYLMVSSAYEIYRRDLNIHEVDLDSIIRLIFTNEVTLHKKLNGEDEHQLWALEPIEGGKYFALWNKARKMYLDQWYSRERQMRLHPDTKSENHQWQLIPLDANGLAECR